MSDTSRALADLKEFLIGRPLFTLGSTDISIGRILAQSGSMLIVLVAWFCVSGERELQRLATRRPQQFSQPALPMRWAASGRICCSRSAWSSRWRPQALVSLH